MKIGIDFGTSYTKIAYPTKVGLPSLFRYGGTGFDYIATAIAYQRRHNKMKIWLGEDAIRRAGKSDVHFYKNFKMRLPIIDEQELIEDGWPGIKSPQEVTRDYLSNLLRSDSSSFENTVKSIDRVIVSVPELWYRDINNPGPKLLLDTMKQLDLNVDRLQSEPVCAAACYAYQVANSNYHQHDNEYNLLVCDVGGGTFDVALCQVKSTSITVLAHDGSGQRGISAAGEAFDRNCMYTAYQKKKGKAPEIDSPEFIGLLNEFEREKISDTDIADGIRDFPDFQLWADEPAYEINNFEVTFSQAYDSFMPIQDGISNVLDRILSLCQEKSWNIDRVLIVGGFGQYPLVRSTICNKLSVDQEVPHVDSFLEFGQLFYAIAYGAYYLVNEEIEAIEPFPHSIGICTKIRSGGEVINSNMVVIKAGQAKAGMINPEYALNNEGELEVVTVEQNDEGSLPIFIQPNGDGILYTPASFQSFEYPPPGCYKIGFHIDRSNLLTLIFDNIKNNVQFKYSLGQLNLVPLEEVR